MIICSTKLIVSAVTRADLLADGYGSITGENDTNKMQLQTLKESKNLPFIWFFSDVITGGPTTIDMKIYASL